MTLMALSESPPRRMKSSSIPMRSIPRAWENASHRMLSASFLGAVYSALSPDASGCGRDFLSTFPLTFSGIVSMGMTKAGTM